VRLKLSFVLPVIQLALALVLLHWGDQIEVATVRRMRYDTLYVSTPTLICDGINEPAKFLAAVSFFFERVDQAPPTIFGMDMDHTLFLAGIIVLWILVGWTLDKCRSSRETRPAWNIAKILLVGLPLSLMGAVSLYGGLQGLMTPTNWNNEIGTIMHSILLLIWSLVLLGIPAKRVVRRLSISSAKC
jgi:hypothetical protein